jgi:hypothetical protein
MAAADPPKQSGSNYDRGEKQALAFSRVLNRWNPLLRDGRTEQQRRLRPRSEPQRRLSNAEVADRIRTHIGKYYWPNDVQRAYDGELRMSHLRPLIVEAYCIALEHTDLESLTEAFYAAELKPPKVTKDALKLAIATSLGGSSSGRRTA